MRGRADTLLFLNKFIYYIGIVAFIALLAWSFSIDYQLCLHIAIVCIVSFLLCTLLRKVIDAPRPRIDDSIYTKKTGESFPSRHVFSSFIIALSWVQLNIYIGAVLCVISIILAYVRVKMGAHHTRDVIGAAILAVICAAVGYLAFPPAL